MGRRRTQDRHPRRLVKHDDFPRRTTLMYRLPIRYLWVRSSSFLLSIDMHTDCGDNLEWKSSSSRSSPRSNSNWWAPRTTSRQWRVSPGVRMPSPRSTRASRCLCAWSDTSLPTKSHKRANSKINPSRTHSICNSSGGGYNYNYEGCRGRHGIGCAFFFFVVHGHRSSSLPFSCCLLFLCLSTRMLRYLISSHRLMFHSIFHLGSLLLTTTHPGYSIAHSTLYLSCCVRNEELLHICGGFVE